MASICCLSFGPFARSLIVRMSWVSHDLRFRKPLTVSKDVVSLKVGYNTGVDDMFQDFTHNRCKRDWSVVCWC